MGLLYTILDFAFRGLKVLILLRIILSWVMPYGRNEFANTIYQLTEPILAPLRVLIPVGNMRIDLAPIAAYFLINVVRNLLFKIIF